MQAQRSSTNPFDSIIQLEEITHYQKPLKSILTQNKNKFEKKNVSYSSNNVAVASHNHNVVPSQSHSPSSSSDESESYDNKVRRDFTQLPTSGREPSNDLSDDNLFRVTNDINETTLWDFTFTLIVLFIQIGSLVTDWVLIVWHYNGGFRWGCGLTLTTVVLGGVAMLHQFSKLQPEQLDRTFRHGKRTRILVNCFPIATTLIVSYDATVACFRSLIYSDRVQYSQSSLLILDLQRSLSRVQSFFQSGPQSAIQLVILLENLQSTSHIKATIMTLNIIFSLGIMTNANLPLKTEDHKAAYLPMTRIFVGIRMFSSLGSRCMATSFLMLGCRCIIDTGNDSLFLPTLTGLGLLIIPRLIFTLTDYVNMKKVRNKDLDRFRDQPELVQEASKTIPLSSIFFGYLATICFPVGDPFWLLWYLWFESGIFMVFGTVAGYSHNCFDDEMVLGIYIVVFLVVFVGVPCVIPGLKVALNRRKVRQVERMLQVQVVEDGNNGSNDRNVNS